MGVSFYYIATRALDLITVILPPALPATLSVGIAAALRRLKKLKIRCINPSKINVASKVDRVCFDKTGTLTEDGLKIYHIVSHSLKENPAFRVFEQRAQDTNNLMASNPNLFHLMSTCHSLRQFAGRVVGDPLEVEMFAFTGLDLPDNDLKREPSLNPSNSRKWTILKEFEFTPDLRRMSVIAKDVSSTVDELFVFTKGSPELMRSMCESSTRKFSIFCFRSLTYI